MNRRLYASVLFAAFLFICLHGCKNRELAGTLESPELRLDVFSHPFSYEITEKSTGETILKNTLNSFSVPITLPASHVENIAAGQDYLEADLALAGSLRKAQIRFSFRNDSLIEVSLRMPCAKSISQTFTDQGEHYYGLWEYPLGGSIDNRGVSAPMLGFPGLPNVNFCSGRAPFYMTSKNYAIYAETFAKGSYRIACLGKTSFSFDAPELRYYIIHDTTYAGMLKAYNEIAGPSFMPPLWAFDSFWWRNDDHEDLGEGVANAQENVLQTASKLKDHKIHASAIWIDRPFTSGSMGWGNMDFDSSFPDPAAMISSLEASGYNLLVWITNRCINSLYDEGSVLGYLFEGYGGEWPAADVRRPEVYDWFKSRLDTFVDMGIKGYKIDRGEELEMPLSAQNEVAYNFHKLSSEGLEARNGNDRLVFARSTFDKSRRYAAIWSGDPDSTFGGLKASVKNVIRSGMINFPFWGSDAGGYGGGITLTKELFARWLEFGAYSPMMEVLIGPDRTVWKKTKNNNFDDELIEIARNVAATHHDMIPYNRSMMYESTVTGMPVVRALVLAYPDDDKVSNMWDEYLFGSELLVAPVTDNTARKRGVYLPEGRWIDYNGRKDVFDGPVTISADAPLGLIPVYAKEGAIIPRGDILKGNNSWTPGWKQSLRIEFFPADSGSSSFNYYTGSGISRITSSTEGDTVRIEFDDPLIDGTVDAYLKGFARIRRNGLVLEQGRDFTYDSSSSLLKVNFSGTTTIEISGTESLF